MIIKSFELNKINMDKSNFFLLYGENDGFKNEVMRDYFEKNFLNKIYKYDEKEILDNKDNFFNSILSKSFFENEKLIIILRATDKIKEITEEIFEKKIDDVKFLFISGILEKKSKLRALFEKNKKTICIPFYADTNQTLSLIVSNYFRNKKISISQQLINIIVERSRGNRQNLKNELFKIETYLNQKKSINLEEILKLTNLSENYNISELTDNCLSKNNKKTAHILNENNLSDEDCIMVLRTLLFKSKRLLKIQKEIDNKKNIDQVITSFKPPIFWKDKEIVKRQISEWSLEKIKKLILEINDIELLIKKNSINSINIVSDFIISKSIKVNN